MRWRSFVRGLLRALFILYCIEAGLFLAFVPWREGWQRLLTDFPIEGLRPLLMSSLSRGAITGFGLVHLVWGAHDLRNLLQRPLARRQKAASPLDV